jgi:hypothetical protein
LEAFLARLIDTEAMGQVTMGMVCSRGLLGASAGTDVILREGAVNVSGRFEKQSSTIILNYSGSGVEARQEIDIVFRRRKHGMRPYFVCPKTKRDCTSVIIVNGIIASKTFHVYHARSFGITALRTSLVHDKVQARLSGTDGRRPARGRNKAKLRESQARRLYKSLGKYAFEIVRAEIERRAEQRELEASFAGPLTSVYAFGEGYAAEENDPCLRDYLDRPRAWLEALPRPERKEFGQKQSLGSVPELDIRIVLKWAVPGKVTGYWPGWSVHTTRGQRILLIVDWRIESCPMLVIRGVYDPERPRWRRIAMVKLRGRCFFECPVNRRPFKKLYLRDDDFMSRVAARLYHDSQLAPARRARRRRNRAGARSDHAN